MFINNLNQEEGKKKKKKNTLQNKNNVDVHQGQYMVLKPYLCYEMDLGFWEGKEYAPHDIH